MRIFPLVGIACALATAWPELPAAELLPLRSVRLLDGPFSEAVEANRAYLLEHDPDRLLAPFLREAGLEPKAASYGNWENSGLDGHTAGHYLSGLAFMIAAGADTEDGELRRRLDYMIAELARCQAASGDGYVGGVPGSRAFWKDIAAGRIDAHGFGINGKWVPWYNLHKTFAGLIDAYQAGGSEEALAVAAELGDWCERLVSGLSDEQMQDMLRAEHGGMNEALANLHAVSGEARFLELAKRFHHRAVLEPLIRGEDRLTGLHANTQIPKVVGLLRVAELTGDAEARSGARFFWEKVVGERTVAFGGNSVSEHFNAPSDFSGMIRHREGPETCNTYNMLRLTELLFAAEPAARYADFYEKALYNHILASIHPRDPGYVYFTPIRPSHYRVYSEPEQGFWCCVGSGMENPGKYGSFIYAGADDGVFVNLFIASEVEAPDLGLQLRQETRFPDVPASRLSLQLERPATFALRVRHPEWVAAGAFAVSVNGQPVEAASQPSSYFEIRREWRDGDTVEIELPMRTTVERLPDGSDWVAIKRGPIVLASPSGDKTLVGLRADGARMAHVAHGPLVPLDQSPALVATAEELPQRVAPDEAAGPLRFRLVDVVDPATEGGLPLMPFFRLHDQRYQMYFQLVGPQEADARRARLAEQEQARAAREAATLDAVAIGEQQPEVEHAFAGEETESGIHDGRRWRHGRWFQYELDPQGQTAAELWATYSGADRDRRFSIFVDDRLLATESLEGASPGEFVEKRYAIPADALAAAEDRRLVIRFVAAPGSLAGGIFDLRLMRAER